ncbi:flavin reductase [Microbacterium sp.]|uniref:flavin reductase n=1 Tax=Microbacterium sp. TaxID=51671 RepID=UPI002631CBA6|nr:flavin reductase [Microbacterium sp.]
MRREKSAWWRAVLGEYPTGVCLVTARASGGEPAGIVVGSFVAVSEEPPLIGFFGSIHSSTLPTIVSSGKFSVSVLAVEHEAVCRAFAQKIPDRWNTGSFIDSPTGSPRLADAAVWFDATIETADTHGDHVFVTGRVTEFGTGSAGAEMPLLFRRAGYGSFAAPSETYDARAFVERLRWASMAERELEELANELDVEVTINTQLGDSVVTLASVAPHTPFGSYDNVGASHPWAAPIASVFAAWASAPRQHAWEEASRHLTGSVDRALIERQLSGVRERGYAIAGDRVMTERFMRLVRGSPTDRDSYARMWADIATMRRWLDSDQGFSWREVAVVQVPVFDTTGDVVLALYAIGLPRLADQMAYERLVQRIRTTADRMSQRIIQAQLARRGSASDGSHEPQAAGPQLYDRTHQFSQWGWGSLE